MRFTSRLLLAQALQKGEHFFTRNASVRDRLVKFNWKSRYAKHKQSKEDREATFLDLKLRLFENLKQGNSLATFHSVGLLYSFYPLETSTEIPFTAHTRASYVVLKSVLRSGSQQSLVNISRLEWLLFKVEKNLSGEAPLSVYMPALLSYILGNVDSMAPSLLEFLLAKPRDGRNLPVAAYLASPFDRLLCNFKVREAELVFTALKELFAQTKAGPKETEYLLASFIDAHLRHWKNLRQGQKQRALQLVCSGLEASEAAQLDQYAQKQIARLAVAEGVSRLSFGTQYLDLANKLAPTLGSDFAVGVPSLGVAKLYAESSWETLAQTYGEALTTDRPCKLDSESAAMIIYAQSQQRAFDKVLQIASSWLNLPANAPPAVWKNVKFCRALALSCESNFHPTKYEKVYKRIFFPTSASFTTSSESKLLFSLLRGYSSLGDAVSRRSVTEMIKQKQLGKKDDILETQFLAQYQ